MVRDRMLGTVCLAVVASFAAATSQGVETSAPVRGAVSPQLESAELLSAADPEESLPMSVTFALRNIDQLDELIAAQQRRGSPEYHRWLTPDEFAARFGASADTYDALADWLRQQGFNVQTRRGRARIDFGGKVGAVERAFGVRMNRYRHRGRRALANADAPLLPARFAGAVQAVRLNTLRLAEPVVRLEGTNVTFTSMAPSDMYTAYNLNPLLDAGIDGAGQTIAIVARSDFNISDVTLFQDTFNVPARTPTKVFPAGNPGVGSPNFACSGIRNPQQRNDCIFGEETEVLLDVEWAGAMAPGASVLVDISDADIDAALADVVEHHPEAKIIGISFALCERFDQSLVAMMDPLYAQAAAQGQTVLVAAGNSGADGCGDGGAASVNGLASSGNVTSVGGTTLDPGFDDNGDATGHVDEFVWNDNDGASGGGVSTVVAKPRYQRVPGVPSGAFRNQPDVALMASPGNVGYVIVIEDSGLIIGGTSAATPSWGGIVALANQAAGLDGSGAINHALYPIAGRQFSGTGSTVFHDIEAGDNGFDGVPGFAAGAGYDRASGLGTPDVAALVEALSAPECVGDCNSDGKVTVDELVIAVSIALGRMSPMLCPSLDANGDGEVLVDDLVQATNHALGGC